MKLGTFSIVARCKKTGDFGVATATAVPCVGAMLPYAEEGVGAIATQAWVNVNLGYQGIELMRLGLSVKSALEALLSEDAGRARRQVVGIDASGSFGFTGEECDEAKGHILGQEHAVAGNMLADKRVIEAVSQSFAKSKGELSQRLLSAIESGQTAGGDRRGKMSAALLIASSKPKLYHNIRVDHHTEPVRELRRIVELCVKLEAEYGGDSDGEDLRRKVIRLHK
jgi:uncharacterized Ntn-hydrolase superfamily protein